MIVIANTARIQAAIDRTDPTDERITILHHLFDQAHETGGGVWFPTDFGTMEGFAYAYDTLMKEPS